MNFRAIAINLFACEYKLIVFISDSLLLFFLMRPLANSRKSIANVAAASSRFSFVFCGAAAAAYIEIWTSIRILIYVNIQARVVHDGGGYILYSYTLVYRSDQFHWSERKRRHDGSDVKFDLYKRAWGVDTKRRVLCANRLWILVDLCAHFFLLKFIINISISKDYWQFNEFIYVDWATIVCRRILYLCNCFSRFS